MPYKSINELPENVTNVLPKHAQEVYKEAFNSAYDQYDKPSERRGDADREERRLGTGGIILMYTPALES